MAFVHPRQGAAADVGDASAADVGDAGDAAADVKSLMLRIVVGALS